MDFVLFLAAGFACSLIIGLATGLLFSTVRHGVLWSFLSCVVLFWLFCSIENKRGVLDSTSLFDLGYTIFMRLFYGALFGSVAIPSYYLGRFMVTRRPRPNQSLEPL
jgi:hypothetical protein